MSIEGVYNKNRGYLAMDYTHYLIPYGDKRVRLDNEIIFDVHVEKKDEVNAILSELEESDQLLEELQIEDLMSMNMLSTIYDMEFRNYYLMELELFISKLTSEDFKKGEVWEMFFDGARSKIHSCTRIFLIDPMGKIHKFSYRLTWMCTNNVAEYEALCLGLEQVIKLQIPCLKIKGDS